MCGNFDSCRRQYGMSGGMSGNAKRSGVPGSLPGGTKRNGVPGSRNLRPKTGVRAVSGGKSLRKAR